MDTKRVLFSRTHSHRYPHSFVFFLQSLTTQASPNEITKLLAKSWKEVSSKDKAIWKAKADNQNNGK